MSASDAYTSMSAQMLRAQASAALPSISLAAADTPPAPGTVAGVETAEARMPGTLAVTLAGIAQGAQIHRVHDVAEIAQGIRLWNAITKGYEQ